MGNKVNHKRGKPKARDRGRIKPEVYEAALERAGGCCEKCGFPRTSRDERKWGLEAAHLERRWKLAETTVNDIAMLCGPSVNSGTCHHEVDYTAAGREWAAAYRERLYAEQKEIG